jgi:S-adenosylmethionine decarboxylase proenzyme
MKAEGVQILAEYATCSHAKLSDPEFIDRIFREELEKAGFSIEKMLTKTFPPVGLTSVAILSQSHAAIHTYPEVQHVALDVFHCSSDIKPCLKLATNFEKRISADRTKIFQLQRGPRLAMRSSNIVMSEMRPGFSVEYLIRKEIYENKSRYQRISIIDNDSFGRMMFLDGQLQVAQSDVYLYNRAMVDPLRSLEDKSQIAILGGGDGGVLAEVLKWNVKEVFVVELDPLVIEASKKHLSVICNHAFDDPRVRIVIADAKEWLKQAHNLQAIFYDLTLHPAICSQLSAAEYLEEALKYGTQALNPGGLWSMQCCSDTDIVTRSMLQKVLPASLANICFERVFIPSYCGAWLFASGLKIS